MTSEDAANKVRAGVSLRSQASEEALRLALQIRDVEDEAYADPNAPECDCYPPIGVYPGGTCDFCMDVLWRMASVLDRVSRERTRQALERACAALCSKCAMEIPAVYFYGAWRHPCQTCGPGVYESCEAAPIRALLSDGESVASEEKEE